MVLAENYKANIGNTMHIGPFSEKEELKFFIHVKNTDITYDTGNYYHATVIQHSTQNWKINFEDSEDKKDWDFNDLVVNIKIFNIDDDYPKDYKNIKCPNCKECCAIDEWGFCIRNCTSFAAWRINRDFGDKSFTNGMKQGKWSNAYNWDDNANKLGILVNSTPEPGAIAQWNKDEIGGGYGHVAYVETVDREDVMPILEFKK